MIEFFVLSARDAAERARWEALHAEWPAREVFAHPCYVGLFAEESDEVLAACARTAAGFVFYPFILRQVAAPHLRAVSARATDIVTAYGYGGPLATGDAATHADAFWAHFDAWCAEREVVSEFVRFSLFGDKFLPYPGEREQKLVNVVRELDSPIDQILRDYDHKVRKNINKATRSGVEVFVEETADHLDDFLRLYSGTMDRRNAQSGFYFPRSFFERIIAGLQGQFAFFHAKVGGQLVSTELVLVSSENVYSYLGGTDAAFFDVRPNDLLKHEIVQWAQRKGKRRFVLGGGYAIDDGIFKYKRAFAPGGLVPFFIGRRVLDPPRYGALAAAHLAEGRRMAHEYALAPGFFPAYRAALPG